MLMGRRFLRYLSLASVLAIALTAVLLAPVARAQEQPKRGGTFVVGIQAEPMHLNPAVTNDTLTSVIGSNVYSTLIKLDRNLNVIPELAEKWDISKDGLTYTFYLRKNVKWHDGKPFTSADVKYSLMEVNRKLSALATSAFGMVETIDAPDPHTVVFKLKHPFAPFFPYAPGFPIQAEILPKHLYEGTDAAKNDYNFKPVGTGPFLFKEWVKGSHITLERNPDFYKPGQPYLDRVVFKFIPDASARVIALEKGEVDHLIFISLPTSAIPTLSNNPDIEVVLDRTRAAYGTIIAFFNLRHPQLKIKEVRQAIAHAIDKKVLVDKALGGIGDPGSSPVSSHQQKFYNPNVPKYEYDPAKANQLLDQAGFPRKADGTRFSIRFVFARGGEGGAFNSAGEIMREQLRGVGINLELQPVDPAAFTEVSHVKWDFDMAMASYSTGPDPALAVSRLYVTENIKPVPGANLMGYSNPKVDQLFREAERETDESKRVGMYNEVQTLIVQDSPALWLWDKYSPVAQRKTVKGGLPQGATHNENFDSIWLTTAAGEQGIASTPLLVGVVIIAIVVVGGVLVIRRLRSA